MGNPRTILPCMLVCYPCLSKLFPSKISTLDQWLRTTETETDTDTDGNDTGDVHKSPPLSKCISLKSQKELYCLQSLSIEDKFQEIQSHSSRQQTKYIFDDLSLLQKTIQDNFGPLKRNINSPFSDSLTSEIISEDQTILFMMEASPLEKHVPILNSFLQIKT